MDLPTYTSIWRIEKRLYKLYDFKLPAPLPIVQLGAGLGAYVVWIVALQLLGVPFRVDPPWHVLYLVPPGVVTWLSTRPVIENKRLHELLHAQLRYFAEPRTWCRLLPAQEPEHIRLTGSAWRRTAPVPARAAAGTAKPAKDAKARTSAKSPSVSGDAPGRAPGPSSSRPAGGPAQREPARAAVTQYRTPASAPPLPEAPSGGRPVSGSGTPGSAQSHPPIRPGNQPYVRPSPPQAVPPGQQVRSTQPTSTGEPAKPTSPVARGPTQQHTQSGTSVPPTVQPPSAIGHTAGSADETAPAAPQSQRQPGPQDQQRQQDAAGPPAPESGTGTHAATPAHPQPGPQPGGTSQVEVPAWLRQPPRAVTERHGESPQPPPAPAPPPQPVEPAQPQPRGEARESAEAQGHAPQREAGPPADEGQRPPDEPVRRPEPPVASGTAAGDQLPAGPAEPQPRAAPAPGRSQPSHRVLPPSRPRPAQSGPSTQQRPQSAGSDQAQQPATSDTPEARANPRGALRRIANAVTGQARSDDEAMHESMVRIRSPFSGTRRIVVLGCTGGAGQTVTALALGHTLASLRNDRCLAVDVNPGAESLSRRARMESPETLSSLLARVDSIGGYLAMRAYTSQAHSRLEVMAAESDESATWALDERDYETAARVFDRYYKLTLLDPAAAVVSRALPLADRLVLVAPASADGARAVGMTCDWLDGHGHSRLRASAVAVINGVSKRTIDDAQLAEAVAMRRCRAAVRVPWDDHVRFDPASPTELDRLRAGTRRSYVDLAGAVAAGFSEVPPRYDQEFSS